MEDLFLTIEISFHTFVHVAFIVSLACLLAIEQIPMGTRQEFNNKVCVLLCVAMTILIIMMIIF